MVSASSIVLVEVSLLLILSSITSIENFFFPANASILPVSEQPFTILSH